MKVIATKDYTAYWNEKTKKVIAHEKEIPYVKEGTIFELELKNKEDEEQMFQQLKEMNLVIPFADYRDIRMKGVFEDDTKTQE
jgi:uncharacterized protein (DUF2344 family)